MRFDEARDNTTAIEANLSEADAREETRETPDTRPIEHRVADAWWAGFNHAKAVAKAEAEQRHEEHDDDGANGYDDDEPEDDGQPSEYEEWQDFMGGDEYYDHSENECW